MNNNNQANCNLNSIGIYIYLEEVRALHIYNADGILILF